MHIGSTGYVYPGEDGVGGFRYKNHLVNDLMKYAPLDYWECERPKLLTLSTKQLSEMSHEAITK
jgi:hypothetical protein